MDEFLIPFLSAATGIRSRGNDIEPFYDQRSRNDGLCDLSAGRTIQKLATTYGASPSVDGAPGPNLKIRSARSYLGKGPAPTSRIRSSRSYCGGQWDVSQPLHSITMSMPYELTCAHFLELDERPSYPIRNRSIPAVFWGVLPFYAPRGPGIRWGVVARITPPDNFLAKVLPEASLKRQTPIIPE